MSTNVKIHLFAIRMLRAIIFLDHIRAGAIRAYLEMVKIRVLVSFASKSSSQKNFCRYKGN